MFQSEWQLSQKIRAKRAQLRTRLGKILLFCDVKKLLDIYFKKLYCPYLLQHGLEMC